MTKEPNEYDEELYNIVCGHRLCPEDDPNYSEPDTYEEQERIYFSGREIQTVN